MGLSIILATLAGISLVLGIWQFVVALRFPPHHKCPNVPRPAPGISILKPLKGCDAQMVVCLTSWIQQNYPGPIEVLFGVASHTDPVCEVVHTLIAAHPNVPAQVVICGEQANANPKVTKLVQLARHARHEYLCVSDADVLAEPDFLVQAMAAMQPPNTGLVNALYRFAPGETFASRLEALAVNADFWSQVLQAHSLGPLRFALGAAMLLSREKLAGIGGFESLKDFLADDHELGRRLADRGAAIHLASSVVECRSAHLTARDVWNHQQRWARTIRACRPWAYFFSILANATLWPILWFSLFPGLASGVGAGICLLARACAALHMESRLTGRARFSSLWLILMKDLLHVILWGSAFVGSTVIWRGVAYRIQAGGKVAPLREAGQATVLEATSPTPEKDAGAA